MALKSSDHAPLRTLQKSIDAGYFNRVRLGLLRLSNPLRIELTELRVDLICTQQSWSCVSQDSRAPLLIWTDFAKQRAGLHRPVDCTLHLYHVHAGLLAAIALETADSIIKQRLIARRLHYSGEVLKRQFRRA